MVQPTSSPKFIQPSDVVLSDSWSQRLPWGGVLLTLSLGVAARDCILIASAAALAIYIARLHIKHRQAVDLWRSAIHCWMVGGASLLIALALVAMAMGAHAGLWEGNGIGTRSMMFILGFCVLTVGAAAVTTTRTKCRRAEHARVITLGVAMALAAFAARALDASGPCLFALSVAAIAAISGWQLARRIGGDLARTAVRI